MPDFETRLNDVSHAAWLIWTANGLGLDDFPVGADFQIGDGRGEQCLFRGQGLGGRHTHALARQ